VNWYRGGHNVALHAAAKLVSAAVSASPMPIAEQIVQLAIAFTDANDRGDALSDEYDEGRPTPDGASEQADEDYNKSKAALFALVRTLTGKERTTRMQGWERAVLDALAAASPVPAQGPEEAMEVLRELVACLDLHKSHAQASAHAAKFPTDHNYAVIDALATGIARRESAAWHRARALLSRAAPEGEPK
jgi:hypothetical protein